MNKAVLIYKDGNWYIKKDGNILHKAYNLAEDAIEAIMASADQEEESEDTIKTEEFSEEEIAFIDILGSMVRTNMLDYEILEKEDGLKSNDVTKILSLLTDAKLSTAKRKKLKSSTFCGPGRSFPVPDCAHVTAARRLIGRAKASADTKAKIMACVNRKAKSMGCDSTSDSTNETIKNLLSRINSVE